MPPDVPDLPLLALDVGNTSVKCAVKSGGQWRQVFKVPTHPVADLTERMLGELPEGGRGVPLERCVAASVHPPADAQVERMWRRAGGQDDVQFLGRDVAVPIRAAVPDAARVGVDRLVLALGALRLCGAPCIVVSAGTAITVDLVDRSGAFAGGAIAPGFGLAARALHEQTALLPLVTPSVPSQDVGVDTAAALASGVYWSCAGGVAALIERYRRDPDTTGAPVICTGSDADLLRHALGEEDVLYRGGLFFDGLEVAGDAPGRGA